MREDRMDGLTVKAWTAAVLLAAPHLLSAATTPAQANCPIANARELVPHHVEYMNERAYTLNSLYSGRCILRSNAL